NGVSGDQEINQSMVGVLNRLLTEALPTSGRYGRHLVVNFVAWKPVCVGWLIKGLSVGFVGLLAFFCRTKTNRRDDARLLGEFALVVLTMLFVSERSWKHHYVTLLLAYTYLMSRVALADVSRRVRVVLGIGLGESVLLIAST